MVETVDTHRELPQAQLFGAQQLADSWRQPLNESGYQFAASHPDTEIFKAT